MSGSIRIFVSQSLTLSKRRKKTQIDAFCSENGTQLRRLESISRNFNPQNSFNPTSFPYSTSPEHSHAEPSSPKGKVLHSIFHRFLAKVLTKVLRTSTFQSNRQNRSDFCILSHRSFGLIFAHYK